MKYVTRNLSFLFTLSSLKHTLSSVTMVDRVNHELFNSKPESGFKTLFNTVLHEGLKKLSMLVQGLKTSCQFYFQEIDHLDNGKS